MQSTQLKVLTRDSQLEVQTEGGIETGYTIRVNVNGPAPNQIGTITLNHLGSPDVITRGGGFTLRRSSGPNRYGEQNFRLSLSPVKAAAARVIIQSTGNRNDAQVAVRWGHPDFNDNEFFPRWTVKSGAAQEKYFRLTADQSEFEVQTEGGDGTGYHISAWLDFGQGMSLQPSFEISHKLKGIGITTSSRGGTSFSYTKGNDYGEINVSVTVPGLPINLPPVPVSGPLTLLFTLSQRQTAPVNGPVNGAWADVFGPSSRGKIIKIQNESQVPIELVGFLRSSADCFMGTSATKALSIHQATTDAEFATLFPQGLPYPVQLVACAYAGATPPSSLALLVTYVPQP